MDENVTSEQLAADAKQKTRKMLNKCLYLQPYSSTFRKIKSSEIICVRKLALLTFYSKSFSVLHIKFYKDGH